MNRDLIQKIKEMVKLDQSLRFAFIKTKRNTSGFGIENCWLYIIDNIHNTKIKELIGRYGYPNKKNIGKKGLRDFWLLIQHQDGDIQLQKDCLKMCEFEKREQAYLTDRISLKETGKQVYGTQFTGKFDKRGSPILKPIINAKGLAKRRKEMGLESIDKYMNFYTKSYFRARREKM